MAPFRNRDRSNRSGRGQVEHNVLEGLPINQYREVEITIGPSSTETKHVDKDAWPELPMPRDAHLLPEHSQQLLRAARAGKVTKAPAPPEEDIENREEEDDHKEVPQGFTVKKWVKVARHLEGPEPEYLAKRRKGLPSQYVPGQVATQPLRETKVKKTDAEGNVVVYKALVPEGQAVEGEVQGADAVIEAAPVVAAPGTVVEGVGVVNSEGVVVANDIMQQTPPRRRPPPPKKKRRSGPGRGKKKVIFAEGADQSAQVSGAGSNLLAVANLKQEGSVEPSEGGDTPMPDAGDEEEGSGEEGSEDEDQEEGTHSPPPTEVPVPAAPTNLPDKPAAQSPVKSQIEDTIMADVEPALDPPIVVAETSAAPVASEESKPSPPSKAEPEQERKTSAEPKRDQSSSPEMPLSTISHSRQNSLTQVPTIAALETTEAPEPPPAPTPVPTTVEVPASTTVEVPASTIEPALEPTVESTTELTAEPTTEPVAEPITEPVTELTTEPIAEPPVVPAIEPAVEPIVEPAVKSPTEPIQETPSSELPVPILEPPLPSAPTEMEAQPTESEAPLDTQDQAAVEAQVPAATEVIEKTPAGTTPEVPPQPEIPQEIPVEQPTGLPAKPPVADDVIAQTEAPEETPASTEAPKEVEADDSEPDLLGSLERHLEKERETMG
ncbi:unnamed protein product [Periconia digitata]|uniref:Uncharacterized protein n=1 Tax=Periconia digitata TaxID=1303443 RepID=A0A9W4UHC6_9PLEO|nr:unnamed protein product [Periconia digitata]